MENKIKSSISKIIHLANSLKTQEVMGLFVLLVALLFLSSKQQVQLFFHSFLGRIVVVSLVALFASHNILLGISAVLVVLCIVQTNMKSFIIEGLTTAENVELTDEQKATIKQKQDTLAQKVAETSEKLKTETDSISGVDRESISEAIKAKPSNELPVPNSTSSDDVSPTTVEAFTSSYSYL